MRRRVLWVSIAFALASSASALVYSYVRGRQADALYEEALRRLDAPLTEAPGLDRLQASTAQSLLERAIALGHDDAQARGLLAYACALVDYQRGDQVLAESELASARHRLGDAPRVSVLAAALARARSRRVRAHELLDRALASAPDDVHARLLAADLALDEDDGPLALSHLEPLSRLAPRSSAVRNRMGLAYELLGDREEAERAYLDAVQADRRDAVAWINLGRLRRLDRRHEEARRAFDEAVRRAPADADAHLGRGLSRLAIGEIDGGRADLERAAELSPNDAEPLLALGDLERDLGRYEQALATYRRAIAREDADAASWLKLGNALALVERYGEAEASFRAAIRRAPELAAAHNGLGASLMHLGRPDDAARALARAAELDPSDPSPLLNLALLRERGGDRDAARRAWERALERDPSSSIARRHLDRLRG